jgi:dTMP kinase
VIPEKGKLIVLDGTDGVGKATQTALLVSRFVKEGYEVGAVEFPQYGSRSAMMVEDYLTGKYGSAEEVGPYVASLFYALDRYAALHVINSALSEGRHVVANRYTASNMGHQGGKIRDVEERKKFWHWLLNLEFEILKLPKPNLTIILHVPAEIAQNMASTRGHQEYLLMKKKLDIHEGTLQHLKETEEAYLMLPKTFPEDFVLVECCENSKMLPPEMINGRVWEIVKEIL